jgi:hypothetical protein
MENKRPSEFKSKHYFGGMVVKPFRRRSVYPVENDPDISFTAITIADWTGDPAFHREHSAIE